MQSWFLCIARVYHLCNSGCTRLNGAGMEKCESLGTIIDDVHLQTSYSKGEQF